MTFILYNLNMQIKFKEWLKILDYTDITLLGKIQEKRSKSYVSTAKYLFNKYGNCYYNLIERGAKLNMSIYTIKKYADKILLGATFNNNQDQDQDIIIGGLTNDR